jgi:GNAT superfamily N-acetyltransferase
VSGVAPIRDAREKPALSRRVRAAGHGDVPAVAIAMHELLIELGGSPALPGPLEEAVHALIDDESAGALLVAENLGEIVGVLGVSWQFAIRIPGRYGLIQELWVHPSWRGRTIGGDLLTALFELARARRIARIEVGLPSERFARLAATEAFYIDNGFTAIGLRMRRLLT